MTEKREKLIDWNQNGLTHLHQAKASKDSPNTFTPLILFQITSQVVPSNRNPFKQQHLSHLKHSTILFITIMGSLFLFSLLTFFSLLAHSNGFENKASKISEWPGLEMLVVTLADLLSCHTLCQFAKCLLY